MARVKRAVSGKKHRRAVLEQAEGYYGNRSRTFRAANEAVMHSLQYAYRDRRARKGDFRRLWIQRINAAARANGMSYSRLIAGLHRGRRGRGPQGARRSRCDRPRGVRQARRRGRRPPWPTGRRRRSAADGRRPTPPDHAPRLPAPAGPAPAAAAWRGAACAGTKGSSSSRGSSSCAAALDAGARGRGGLRRRPGAAAGPSAGRGPRPGRRGRVPGSSSWRRACSSGWPTRSRPSRCWPWCACPTATLDELGRGDVRGRVRRRARPGQRRGGDPRGRRRRGRRRGVLRRARSTPSTRRRCGRRPGSVLHLPVVVGGDAGRGRSTPSGAAGMRRLAAVVARRDALHRGRAGRARWPWCSGNEASGLPPRARARASTPTVTIPMGGRAESLNVAMAAAVLCFEVRRRRSNMHAMGGARVTPSPAGDDGSPTAGRSPRSWPTAAAGGRRADLHSTRCDEVETELLGKRSALAPRAPGPRRRSSPSERREARAPAARGARRDRGAARRAPGRRSSRPSAWRASRPTAWT